VVEALCYKPEAAGSAVAGLSVGYRQVLFYSRVTFLKNIMQIEHTFPIKTMHFFGVGGLTTSSYVVYDYTITGHMDLKSMYVLYIKFIYIFIQYNCLFLMQYKCKRLTFKFFGTVLI
jgi:hypothetical protein